MKNRKNKKNQKKRKKRKTNATKNEKRGKKKWGKKKPWVVSKYRAFLNIFKRFLYK